MNDGFVCSSLFSRIQTASDRPLPKWMPNRVGGSWVQEKLVLKDELGFKKHEGPSRGAGCKNIPCFDF